MCNISVAQANLVTGIGYISPEEYRTDNEINPLPLGLSFVPMIAYHSERLRIYGPNISYNLLRGSIGFDLKINVVGDRYQAYEVEKRDTAINGGASIRLFFLSIHYGSDIARTYNGNMMAVSLVHRFKFGEKLTIIPRFSKEYLNKSFTRYYYGVRDNETGEFRAYTLNEAVNDIYALNSSLKLDEQSSIALSYAYKKFDNEIFKSPTIALKGYSTWSLFWNFKI